MYYLFLPLQRQPTGLRTKTQFNYRTVLPFISGILPHKFYQALFEAQKDVKMTQSLNNIFFIYKLESTKTIQGTKWGDDRYPQGPQMEKKKGKQSRKKMST